jgi:hypothetical protein
MPNQKAPVATGNSMLTIILALLADPEARYTDLGPDYYDQRMQARSRPATTSRAWKASAAKSPSTPSTPTPADSTPQPTEQLLALAQPPARRGLFSERVFSAGFVT